MFVDNLGQALFDLTYVPLHLKIWLWWLASVVVVLPFFLITKFPEARMIVYGQLGNIVIGTLIAGFFGLVRLTGLAHVIAWTPVAYYLWTRLDVRPPSSWVGIWLRITLATMLVSLVLDYADVVRWILGDRDRMGAGWGAPMGE